MMRGSNYIKHKEKMILSKYTIRTEAETIFTDKVKMLEKSDMNITYIYVEENHILYRIIFCGSDDDIHSILVAFILVFVGASLMIFYFL